MISLEIRELRREAGRPKEMAAELAFDGHLRKTWSEMRGLTGAAAHKILIAADHVLPDDADFMDFGAGYLDGAG